jgi:hypothetical protein
MIAARVTRGAAVAAVLVLATTATGFAATQTTVGVSPAPYTPWLLRTVPNQNVQQLVPCGDTMYAVGTITAIGQGSLTYSRSNAFSFSATTGAVSAWSPQVNGPVHSVALSPDCQTAYLGGAFTAVNGVTVKNLVAVDSATGDVRTGFAHTASGPVDTLQFTHGAVLAGGTFTVINGAKRTRLASLDPTTGKVTAYANLPITGAYPNTTTRVFNSQLSHSGSKLLVEGVFTSIGGQARQQIAVLDLDGTSVTVDGWYSDEFNQACVPNESFYVRAGSWAVDDATIYVATTGYKPASGPGSDIHDPRAQLCDSAAAFPATSAPVSHIWVNYTGCDSYYAVVADADNVYVGGHERWANNPLACDQAGAGSVARPGMASLSPATGLATSWNPTRSLGHGADDMVITSAGLWVASDNFTNGGAQMCGGVKNKGGICFLPY